MTRLAGRPVVTVVIPVRDMVATIDGQLAALARQDFTDPWDIVVADNGSRDGTIAVVERWQDRLPVSLIEAAGPANSCYARNIGVAAAEGDMLAFCDADDEVRADWLRVMVRALQKSALVTGILDHAKLNPPELAASYEDEADVPWWGFLRAGPAANLGVQRAVFDSLGGFPELYQGWNDAAFCWRAQLAGYELAFEPAAVVDRRLKAVSPWRFFALHVRQGAGLVGLYEGFRDYGMPRSPVRDVVYDYLSIPVRLASGERYRAARAAGWRIGRLVGSIRAGVWCL
jgi:glycosyltransferase involved in cell wall biosynthesis